MFFSHEVVQSPRLSTQIDIALLLFDLKIPFMLNLRDLVSFFGEKIMQRKWKKWFVLFLFKSK